MTTTTWQVSRATLRWMRSRFAQGPLQIHPLCFRQALQWAQCKMKQKTAPTACLDRLQDPSSHPFPIPDLAWEQQPNNPSATPGFVHYLTHSESVHDSTWKWHPEASIPTWCAWSQWLHLISNCGESQLTDDHLRRPKSPGRGCQDAKTNVVRQMCAVLW
jgi:hypothetical protein